MDIKIPTDGRFAVVAHDGGATNHYKQKIYECSSVTETTCKIDTIIGKFMGYIGDKWVSYVSDYGMLRIYLNNELAVSEDYEHENCCLVGNIVIAQEAETMFRYNGEKFDKLPADGTDFVVYDNYFIIGSEVYDRDYRLIANIKNLVAYDTKNSADHRPLYVTYDGKVNMYREGKLLWSTESSHKIYCECTYIINQNLVIAENMDSVYISVFSKSGITKIDLGRNGSNFKIFSNDNYIVLTNYDTIIMDKQCNIIKKLHEFATNGLCDNLIYGSGIYDLDIKQLSDIKHMGINHIKRIPYNVADIDVLLKHIDLPFHVNLVKLVIAYL